MCGIAAYIGKNPCREFVLEGLTRLEYRGYDSAGFVCIDSRRGTFTSSKAVGRLFNLKEKLATSQPDGFSGMGHTRWATHGSAAHEENAHPHFDCTKKIAVVHNGIIESHSEIRKRLSGLGHTFHSATDTEMVAHLLEEELKHTSNLKDAFMRMVGYLQGAYAFVFLLEEYPKTLVVIRHRSPLVVGVGDHEMYAASDPLVFSDKTSKVLFLPDNSFAFLSTDSLELYDFAGNQLQPSFQELDAQFKKSGTDGFEHYMLKEIYEQKQAIDRTITAYSKLMGAEAHWSDSVVWKQLGITQAQVAAFRTIHIIAAGTSWHAGRIAQFFFEEVMKIPTRVLLASEFRYMPFFPEKNSLYIFVSQSGETSDTLEALRLVNGAGMMSLALTNVATSTIVREAHGFLLTHAGPEIAVASTKAFSTQLALLYWLAHCFAYEKKHITAQQMEHAEEDVLVAGEILESSIENYRQDIINTLAPYYARFDRFIFLGRHISYPFALEASLKLKEISYIFAQCYPSGELKHGPIALIDAKTPVLLFSVLDPIIYSKLLSNAQEVKARNGHLVVFAFEGQDELIALADYAFIFPPVARLLAPLVMTGVMQFFVYQITKILGHPIDKPRNLAKSVTVE